MNLNPVASGNKTAAGINGAVGASWMTLAFLLLPKFGFDDSTVNLVIGFAPPVVLGIIGVGHRIIKAGGIKKVYYDFKKKIWG